MATSPRFDEELGCSERAQDLTIEERLTVPSASRFPVWSLESREGFDKSVGRPVDDRQSIVIGILERGSPPA